MKPVSCLSRATFLPCTLLLAGCLSTSPPENSTEALANWHDCMDEEFFDTGRIRFQGHYTIGMTHEQAIDWLIGRCSRELDRYEQALIAEGEPEDEAAATVTGLRENLRIHLRAITRRSSGMRPVR